MENDQVLCVVSKEMDQTCFINSVNTWIIGKFFSVIYRCVCLACNVFISRCFVV